MSLSLAPRPEPKALSILLNNYRRASVSLTTRAPKAQFNCVYGVSWVTCLTYQALSRSEGLGSRLPVPLIMQVTQSFYVVTTNSGHKQGPEYCT